MAAVSPTKDTTMASSGTYATLDNRNLIALFAQLYEGSLNSLWSNNLAMSIPSDRETENYGWLGAAPALTELKGESMPEEGFKQFAYALTNKEYAKAISIREKDMRRDKIGQIRPRIGEMAQKAAEHWDVLTAAAIVANGNAYDGVAFFASTHAESGSNQVNLLTTSHYSVIGDVSTATTPTIAEMANILPSVVGHFHTLTDDKGDPINGGAKAFTILSGSVPIWAAVNGALSSVTVVGASNAYSNPVMGVLGDGYSIRNVLSPRLSSFTTDFFIFRNDGIVKPFIHQEEVPLESQMTDTGSDEYKKFRRFLFSIYTSRAVGYGRWQSAIRVTLS